MEKIRRRDRLQVAYDMLCSLRDNPDLPPTRRMAWIGVNYDRGLSIYDDFAGFGYVEKLPAPLDWRGNPADKRTKFVYRITDVGREVLAFLEGHPLGRWCVGLAAASNGGE